MFQKPKNSKHHSNDSKIDKIKILQRFQTCCIEIIFPKSFRWWLTCKKSVELN